MKFYEFKGRTDKEPKKRSMLPYKRKIIIKMVIIAIIVLMTITAICIYSTNEKIRTWVDHNILRKEITNEDVSTIKIDSDKIPNIYAYNKYIVTLKENKLDIYNSYGKLEKELDISISKPIFESSGKYLAIAENYGKKIYLISGMDILWEKDIEGEISRLNVNLNGFVSVAISRTSHKTLVITYNQEGTEQFKTYLATTYGVDIELSDDNNYLAIAEINSSGTTIQTNIKIISTEKAKSDSTKAIVYAYSAENDEMIVNIKYQNKNSLICLYDSKIKKIENEKNEELFNLEENVLFADINLNNNIIKVIERKQGIFNTESEVKITNIDKLKENIYIVQGIPKSIYACGNILGINLGTEVHFIDNNCWLQKKYVTKQEVKDIVICENLAGVIYKDRIEIVKF